MMPGNDRGLRQHLMQLSVGYWQSQVLFAANELGVFVAEPKTGFTSEQLAEREGLSLLHTSRLLNACVAVGLLEKDGACYRNSGLTNTFLVPDSPNYMGNWIRFMASCYNAWGKMTDVVRTGSKVTDGREELERGEDFTRDLILAMHDYARNLGRSTAHQLNLQGRRRLLDVGGGPGTHSILLAQANPELTAVVLDLPSVVTIAQEIIDKANLSGRVTVQAGNYLEEELGRGYDVVLLSNMLHQEDPEVVKDVLRKARRALADGGLLVVQAAFLDDTDTGPLWPVLQSLQLLLYYQAGRAYSANETMAMLREVGFKDPKQKLVSMLIPESLILAIK